jgi:hypothetical protein
VHCNFCVLALRIMRELSFIRLNHKECAEKRVNGGPIRHGVGLLMIKTNALCVHQSTRVLNYSQVNEALPPLSVCFYVDYGINVAEQYWVVAILGH